MQKRFLVAGLLATLVLTAAPQVVRAQCRPRPTSSANTSAGTPFRVPLTVDENDPANVVKPASGPNPYSGGFLLEK